MDAPVLTCKDQRPTEEIIFSYIGKYKELWNTLFCFIRDTYPDFTENWNYYNDGKCWLLKVTKKKNTVFWLTVIDGAFKITFYFTDKAAEQIEESKISPELKEQFRNAKYYNKIRPLTVRPKYKKDVEYIKSLISIKLSIK